jgi:hypothetical protein
MNSLSIELYEIEGYHSWRGVVEISNLARIFIPHTLFLHPAIMNSPMRVNKKKQNNA